MPFCMTPEEIRALTLHYIRCAQCRDLSQEPCDEGAKLVGPLSKRLADAIDEHVAEQVYGHVTGQIH